MVRDFGNTPAAARLVTLNTTPKVLRNSIGKRDKFDVIRLQLDSTSFLDIRGSGLGNQANLALLDSSGQVIKRFRRSRKNQIFGETVSAGIYYVQVAAKNRKSSANYTLRMSATPTTSGNTQPQREDISWEIIPPGSNLIPEGFVLPGTDAQYAGQFEFQGGDSQTFRLSQLVDGIVLSQILDRDGSTDSTDTSIFPFINFSLSGSRRLSRVEIEKVELQVNDALEIVDYKITLFVSNDGRGSSSTGGIRLPDAEFSSNDEVKPTDITLVLLDGTPFSGSDRAEWIYGSRGNDSISSNNGDDYILGGEGDDTLSGGNGDDYLNGGAGNDRLDGGLANFNDTMRGGAGNDYYIVRNFGDNVYELQAGGSDTIESYVDFRLTGFDDFGSAQYVENLILAEAGNATNGAGNADANNLLGNGLNNILIGQEGNDFLSGGNGDDLLVGGLGQDALVGGNGADLFAFDSPNEGIDIIRDFQPGVDFIRIFRDFDVGFHPPTGFEVFWYDESTGNLSFGDSLSQSTVFARLENKPTLTEPIAVSSLQFRSSPAAVEFF